MAGEAGGAPARNLSHQLAAFRASQSLADAHGGEGTISSGDQEGVGERRESSGPGAGRLLTPPRANSSSPFAIISGQVLTERRTCFSPPNYNHSQESYRLLSALHEGVPTQRRAPTRGQSVNPAPS